MGRRFFVLLMALFLAPFANATPIINEIMYAPPSEFEGTDNEWVEIYNSGDTEIDLTGWTFAEVSQNHTLSGTISPLEYIILSRKSENFTQYYGITSGIIEVKFKLNNDGEELVLKNAGGQIIDNVTYAPIKNASGKGKTLERNGLDWLESTVPGGTPGAQNSASFGAQAIPNPANESENSETETPTPVNETEIQTQETQTENMTEEQTETQSGPQNQETDTPASMEIINAPDAMKFGEYSSVRARFNSGSTGFENARFVAYIYKPSWIARDLNSNGATLRNSLYNSNAAAEVSGISAGEGFYVVLPLFLKCNTEGYADTTYTARVRAYIFENSEWKSLAESDREIFVSGESDACKKEKETAKEAANDSTASEKCAETTKVIRESALEINVTYPEIVFGSENFTTTVFVKNNGETLRDLEIYSYLFEHSAIMSSGFNGEKWANARTANSKKVALDSGNSATIELINRARENTAAEKYTYKVRFDDLADDKKSEERIYLIELATRNMSETNEFANSVENGALSNSIASNSTGTKSASTEAKSKITGDMLSEKTKLRNISFFDKIIYTIKSWLT